MKSILAFIALCTLLLAGCSTSYQSIGLNGGFSDTELEPNIFRVTFRGNSYTSETTTYELALLRAAELSLEKNNPYFVVLTDKYKKTLTRTTALAGSSIDNTPGITRNTVDRLSSSVPTGYSSPVSSGSTAYSRSQVYAPPSIPVSSMGPPIFNIPQTSFVMRLFKQKPPTNNVFDVFDAAAILKALKQKYNIR